MKLIVLIMMMSWSIVAYSADTAKGAKIKVNGMVCSFCSTSIEKKFRENKEITTVNVDLDKKIVSVTFAPGKELGDEKMNEIITKSGYTVVSIEKEK